MTPEEERRVELEGLAEGGWSEETRATALAGLVIADAVTTALRQIEINTRATYPARMW